MPAIRQELVTQAHQPSPKGKLSLANEMLEEIDAPDPRIEALWAEEVRPRIEAHERGPRPTVSLEEILSKYRKHSAP